MFCSETKVVSLVVTLSKWWPRLADGVRGFQWCHMSSVLVVDAVALVVLVLVVGHPPSRYWSCQSLHHLSGHGAPGLGLLVQTPWNQGLGSPRVAARKVAASSGVACVWDPFDLPTEPHTRVGNPFV